MILERVARSLIAWVEAHADPSDREWIRAMRGELESIDGGLAQLRWAAGAVLLLWRPYRLSFFRFVLCVAAVTAANYVYPWFAFARSAQLFFFAHQVCLPVVGIIAARATRSVLGGAAIGTGVSLLAFVVLQLTGWEYPLVGSIFVVENGAWRPFAFGIPPIVAQIMLFAVVGAALGTAGAEVAMFPRRTAAPLDAEPSGDRSASV